MVIAEEPGFTIQELIVALVVGSILVGYAFELYVFSERVVSHWRNRTELTEIVNGALNRIALDLERGGTFEVEGDSVLVVSGDVGLIALYRFSEGTAFTNDVQMNPVGSSRLAFSITSAGELVMLEVRGRSRGMDLASSTRIRLAPSSTGRFMRHTVESAGGWAK